MYLKMAVPQSNRVLKVYISKVYDHFNREGKMVISNYLKRVAG